MRYEQLSGYLRELMGRSIGNNRVLVAAFGLLAAARMWPNYDAFCRDRATGDATVVRSRIERLAQELYSLPTTRGSISNYLEGMHHVDFPKIITVSYLEVPGHVPALEDQIEHVETFLLSGSNSAREQLCLTSIVTICEYLAERNGRDVENQNSEPLLRQELEISKLNIDELQKAPHRGGSFDYLLARNFSYGTYGERTAQLQGLPSELLDRQGNLF